jgi:tetratricopeptide (TPR) repeat protein
MNYKSFLFILLFLGCGLTASANYTFDARCLQAYKAIFDFRLNDARELIRQEKQQYPQNGITILLDNYVDYISLLTSDNKSDYDKFASRRSERIDALEDNKENSPYYLFAQAEVYLQWGLIKGRFGDYMSSATDLKKARNLLQDNAKKYPDFLPDQKSLALIDVVFGSLPSNLKGIAKFLGMQGNIQAGYSQLEKLRTQVQNTKFAYYKNEVIFFLCIMDVDVLHDKSNYAKLSLYLNDLDSQSILKTYLQGYVASKTGHNDDAIASLLSIPKSNQYIELPIADYLIGCAKLCRMDADAVDYLQKYIDEYRGINYIKDSYLKIAYFYLLKNDDTRYNYYLRLVRIKGYKVDEKDQQALKEANDTRPDIDLLRARFYFDGGYYNKAMALLQNKPESNMKLLRDKTELNYRLGRVYQMLNRYNDAVDSYQKAITLGRPLTYYYAANAALNAGNIYEYIKSYDKAADYYNMALGMRNHEYQNSIDTQAKEGLERIGR